MIHTTNKIEQIRGGGQTLNAASYRFTGNREIDAHLERLLRCAAPSVFTRGKDGDEPSLAFRSHVARLREQQRRQAIAAADADRLAACRAPAAFLRAVFTR